jgi:hypothetical protein
VISKLSSAAVNSVNHWFKSWFKGTVIVVDPSI